MPCDLIAGEDYLLPAVALAEIVDVASLVNFVFPTADVLFLHGQHSRSVGLEIRIHISPWRRRKTASALPFREGETVCFRWCGQQDLNLHGVNQ